MFRNHACPSCNSEDTSVFYQVHDVPINSVVLLPTREAALSYPQGNIALAFCQSCGFIFNAAFEPDLIAYAPGYEATQSFSPTFTAFARRLAQRLIDEYALHDKEIIEIGCGQGEFLTLLCELGNNRGVGFDPAYVSARDKSKAQDRITFIQDFYSEQYADYHADFVCCKMTLEHIPDTYDFVSTVRRSLGKRSNTVVFFQVPDVRRILRESAFWDIYYEHCSYFSMGSLARLFRRCGFDVINLAREYDDQYLMIETRPGDRSGSQGPEQEDDLEGLARDVTRFAESIRPELQSRRRDLVGTTLDGQRTVLWGGGSKAVAFLTTLGIEDEVLYAVDINPHKQGTYLAGTGQEIVAPGFLLEYQPDRVIVMNSIYLEEIRRDLLGMGLTPELVTV
jgi:SAM-dependent methyltransferase